MIITITIMIIIRMRVRMTRSIMRILMMGS